MADSSCPKVVVLIVAYNSRGDLEECLSSVLASDDGPIGKQVVVVDNASEDDSAALVQKRFPQVDLVRSESNRGFAGGNNLGWEHVKTHHGDASYLALLNADTIVESGWLVEIVDFLESHPKVGSVQPKIRLHPHTERINTAGNRSHFLGFGFVTAFDQVDEGQCDQARSIDFASGAALMVRTGLLERFGLFDEEMFLYLEDADLSWKLRAMGYDTMYVPGSVVYHKHNPNKALQHYFHLELNRWRLLFGYYRWRTLFLIGPCLDLMELGTLLFALRHGFLRQKLRSYGALFHREVRDQLFEKRRWIQAQRVVGDRELMGRFTGTIDFPGLGGPLVRYMANPILGLYWRLVRPLIRW